MQSCPQINIPVVNILWHEILMKGKIFLLKMDIDKSIKCNGLTNMKTCLVGFGRFFKGYSSLLDPSLNALKTFFFLIRKWKIIHYLKSQEFHGRKQIHSSAHNKPRYNLGNKPGYITCWRTWLFPMQVSNWRNVCHIEKVKISSLEHFWVILV